MLLTIKSNLAEAANRERLIQILSKLLDPLEKHFEPYKPNANDDTFWTLDTGNNWKVQFFPEQPNLFELRFRYQCPTQQYEEALAAWLAIRFGVVPAETQT